MLKEMSVWSRCCWGGIVIGQEPLFPALDEA